MRSNSSYSDIFTNIFDDDDFSIATPTIYTDATDDNTTLTSYNSRRKSKKDSLKKKKKSESKAKHEDDDESEDDFDYLPMGCRTTGVLEEFKIFSELFVPVDSCSCSKIEDVKSTRRIKDRRSTKGRGSRKSRAEA